MPGKNDKEGDQPEAPGINGIILALQSSQDVKRFAKKYRTEISASTSSVLSTALAFPLDFAKSRMQSYGQGFTVTVKDAYKAEGLRAFWRGVGPPMVSVTVVRTLSFSMYQKSKYFLDRSILGMTGKSPLAIANAPGSYPNAYTLACFGGAGAMAGAFITVLSCPFELTKLNEQLAGKMAREETPKSSSTNRGGQKQSIDVKTGSWNTARRLFRDRGFAGLYAGYRLHLLRDTIGTAIYFTTYESSKQLMANARGKSPTSPYAVIFAGGTCGIVSWACVSTTNRGTKLIYLKADSLFDLSYRRRQDRLPKEAARSRQWTRHKTVHLILPIGLVQRYVTIQNNTN